MLLEESVFKSVSCSQVKIRVCGGRGKVSCSPSHKASITGPGPNGSSMVSAFINGYLFIAQLLN